MAPVGVASKRNLFEKELASQSRAEPASSRKVRGEALLGSLQAYEPRGLQSSDLGLGSAIKLLFHVSMLEEP